MFGISAPEFVVLLAVAAVVLGPERLPQYAQSLARLVRELRRMAQSASEQVRSELGPEFEDVDWRKLDPRQYDPRRIVREALTDTIDLQDPLGLRDKPVSSGGPQPLIPPAPTPEPPTRPDPLPTSSSASRAEPRRDASSRGAVPLDPDAT